jgi:hypothetical protein
MVTTKLPTILSIIFYFCIDYFYTKYQNILSLKLTSRVIFFILGIFTCLSVIILIAPTPEFDNFNKNKLYDFLKEFLILKSDQSYGILTKLKTPFLLSVGYFEYSGFFMLFPSFLLLINSFFNIKKLSLFLFLSSFIGLLSFGVLSVTFNRYIHFLQVPFYLALGLSMANVLSIFTVNNIINTVTLKIKYYNYLVLISCLACIVQQLYISIKMMHYPYYNIAESDRFSYETGWASGIGVREIANELENIALHSSKGLYVVTTGWGSHGSWTLPLYMKNTKQRITFYHSWIHSQWQRDKLKDIMKNNRLIFFIERPIDFVSQSDLLQFGSFTKTLFSYKKPNLNTSFDLVEVYNDTN